jgi:hypothetical protein
MIILSPRCRASGFQNQDEEGCAVLIPCLIIPDLLESYLDSLQRTVVDKEALVASDGVSGPSASLCAF